MRSVKVVNLSRNEVLAETAAVAETPRSRRRGLLDYPPLARGEGLLIVPCRQVHTFGMRYPIDVIFVDASWAVRRTVRGLRPGRLSPLVLSSRAALELPAGTIEDTGTEEADLLDARPAD